MAMIARCIFTPQVYVLIQLARSSTDLKLPPELLCRELHALCAFPNVYVEVMAS